ncbi:MAG: hypothetical protein ACYCT2_04535 [Thermoplasmataceae archaeon]
MGGLGENMAMCDGCGKDLNCLIKLKPIYRKQKVRFDPLANKIVEVGPITDHYDEETLWCCPYCGQEIARTGPYSRKNSEDTVIEFLRGGKNKRSD